jgi:hypothetical protein
MKEYHGKPIEYWKNNAEEDYSKTPISVLKYINILEEQKAPEMLEMLKDLLESWEVGNFENQQFVFVKQLIKEATELN